MSKYIRINGQVFETYDETAKGFKARPVSSVDPSWPIADLDPNAFVKPILTPKQKAERRRDRRKNGSASHYG